MNLKFSIYERFSLFDVLYYYLSTFESNVEGLFDLPKLLNLVTNLLFVLHGFSTMTSVIKILLFDLPGFNPGFKIVLKLLKLLPEVVFRFGF